MKKGNLLLILSICSLASFPVLGQGTLTQIKNSGPNSKRINIVFLSEGYTSAELTNFDTDAQTLLNYILGSPPYNWYTNYFNAFTIEIASLESGSDHPAQNIYRNTYFNSTYGPQGMERLLYVPYGPTGEGKVMSLLMNHLPDYNIVIVIINDTEYGGSACGQNGWIAATSVNQYSPEIVLHELGHSFVNLIDEYTAPYPGYVPMPYPNSTYATNPSLIKWNAWFLPSTPIPTVPQASYPNVIGLFEGCQYQTTGWYRPKYDCKMNNLFIPFCEVCIENHVYAMYKLISPIESYSPQNLTNTIGATDSTTLSVNPIQPDFHSLSVQWSINGIDVPGAVNASFTAYGYLLNDGPNTIKAIVTDTIPVVLSTNLKPQLQDSIRWTIDVSGTVVSEEQSRLSHFTLYPNYPNPFNPETTISFGLAEPSMVTITVINMSGKEVTRLFDGGKERGYHALTWNAWDCPSGVYFIRMQAGTFTQMRKCVLMK